jgi:hypothetical protein
MGWAVQLGLDKSAVVRLLRLAVEGLDRLSSLAATAPQVLLLQRAAAR